MDDNNIKKNEKRLAGIRIDALLHNTKDEALVAKKLKDHRKLVWRSNQARNKKSKKSK